jgi:glycosyltransferase involved in cell wall biosynthesis
MINPPKVSIILPSLDRPVQLISTLDNIIYTSRPIPIEIIVLLNQSDYNSQTAMKDRPFLLIPDDFSPIQAWNYGASLSSGEWLYLGSDDVVHPDHWLEKSLDTPNQGFIGLGDGTVKDWALFFLVTKDWCKKYQGGVFLVPHYHNWGVDPEASLRAKRSGTYTLAPVILDHRHYQLKKSKRDSTYIKAEKYHKKDTDLFLTRQGSGFPDDFEGYL